MTKKLVSKILAVILACFVFIASACNGNETPAITTTNPNNSSEISTAVWNKEIKETLVSNNDIGGADLVLHKYRMNYYTIPSPFAKIVETEAFESWYSEILMLNPNETNIMIIKEFIQKFNVSREDFDKANLEWAKIVVNNLDGVPMMDPKDFSNQETDEVYNADILYTFDDEIINNYYLSHDYPYTFSDEYEQAVANGEYVPQTTDWIDIEAMEAEIIAKYGEAEIVTESTTEEQTKALTTA